MDYDDYKNLLRMVKKEYGRNLGLGWNVPQLRPVHDVSSQELIGWKLKWAGAFAADAHYVCVREDWAAVKAGYDRRYFSYHYGPYHRLDDLEEAKWKAVVVRIDAANYDGRGFHIHDGHKNRRIHQDQLSYPELSKFTIPDFINCVAKMRQGRSVTEAFDLRFRE